MPRFFSTVLRSGPQGVQYCGRFPTFVLSKEKKRTVMDLKQYLDSTYLETPALAGISFEQYREKAESYIREAIDERFKLIMIRPDMVATARKMIDERKSPVLVGTVIGFPEGTYTTEEKLSEARQAIADGVDELDFVADYPMYKRGKVEYVAQQVRECTKLVLDAGKTAKWILETAALRPDEIEGLSELIRDTVLDDFGPQAAPRVFLKTSTGFFKTTGGQPSGATPEAVRIMVRAGAPLPVKAAGGVRDARAAREMIELGVTRIGTSSAKKLADGQTDTAGY